MKKLEDSDRTNMTSFYGDVFNASVEDLKSILGEPISSENDGEDKVNFDWAMETESGQVFTVYDWKQYRSLSEFEIVEWHIGGHTSSVTAEALAEIAGALNNMELTQ